MEIGSIVECINDKWDHGLCGLKMPVKGRLYTVTGFCNWPKGEGIYIDECSDLIHVQCHITKCRLGLFKSPFLKSRFVERLSAVEISVEEIMLQEI